MDLVRNIHTKKLFIKATLKMVNIVEKEHNIPTKKLYIKAVLFTVIMKDLVSYMMMKIE